MSEIRVHETAFMTAAFRDRHLEVSLDNFAHLWNNPDTDRWVKRYLEEVSPFESLTHCLRNRFFLEAIRQQVREEGIEVLINFGSGFSMYPYLLNDEISCIEIDQENVIAHKKNRLQEFLQKGQLPKRTIQFIAADFSQDLDPLEKEISKLTRGKRTFILLEGVLFFLKRSWTDDLFDLFQSLQKKGDLTACVSFDEHQVSLPVFQRLLNFFNQHNEAISDFDFQTLEDDYFHELDHYKMIQKQNYLSLSKEYAKIDLHSHVDDVLIENLYLLRRC